LDGPAGTGKSRAALEKLNICMEMWPGSRGLIVRKTRRSITQSCMVTFQRKVLPERSRVKFNSTDQEYRYPNGSIVAVAGLDDPSKVMSAEYDFIYLNEGTECNVEDYEALLTRCRNGVMPFQQVVTDVNPGDPRHWINIRANRGDMVRLLSRHQDNPLFWDASANDWTPAGKSYWENLSKLTGARLLRLRDGIWAAAEGIVYDGWDPGLHIVDHFEVPAEWRRFRTVDFGYNDPFVCLWFALSPDEVLFLYREIYMSGRIVEDHAAQITALSEGETFERSIADHDAEDRETLHRHGVRTVKAKKAISPGIQKVAARLRKAGNGKPRLHIMRDALVERDSALEDRKRPCCTAEEFDSYVWATNVDGTTNKEVPLDADNHGMDALRYMVAHLDLVDSGVERLRIKM
ncbi:MAG: phage terminase large subunit, partial [Chloroflexota bacterium]|nr:phage terminase large subunit [Chloroflexota bacterium]